MRPSDRRIIVFARRYPDRPGVGPATLTGKDVACIYNGQGGKGGQGVFAQKLSWIFQPSSCWGLKSFLKYTLTTLTTLAVVDKYGELSGQGSPSRRGTTLTALPTSRGKG